MLFEINNLDEKEKQYEQIKNSCKRKKIQVTKKCSRCNHLSVENIHLSEIVVETRKKGKVFYETLWNVDNVEKPSNDFIPLIEKITKKDNIYGPIGKFKGLDYYITIPSKMYCYNCGEKLEGKKVTDIEEILL